MLRTVGAEAEPLLPPGGERGRVGRPRPQPPRADGHERSRVARRAGGVVDRPGLHLRLLEDERHRLLAIEDDPPRGDLVAEAHRPRFKAGPRAPGHDGRPLGLDLDRLQPGGHRPRFLVTTEDDCKEIAGQLIVGAARERADDVDMILERDHIRRHVHAQAPPAADKHWRRLLGALGRRGCRGHRAIRPHRPGDGRPRDQSPGEPFELELHVAVEADRVDPADAWPLLAPLRSGEEADLHRAAASGRAAIAELHRLGGADLHLLELDIAGHDLHLVVGLRGRRRAPDRHLPAEAPADEPRRPLLLAQVERLVELEHGPLRGAEDDRPPGRGPCLAAGVGKENERAGDELHARIVRILAHPPIVFEEEAHLPALEHVRPIELPRAGGEERRHLREPAIGPGLRRGDSGRGELLARHCSPDARLHQRHDDEPVKPGCREHDEKHPQGASEAMFHA